MLALPEIAITRNSIHHMDLFALCNALADKSVDMILCDLPYYAVVAEAWDNQWHSESHFVDWLDFVLVEFRRILKPTGSMYLFASHKLHATVEYKVRQYFNVLNNIVWVSNGATTKRADRTKLRSYIPTTEHIIFAEHRFQDKASGYSDSILKLKKDLYLDAEQALKCEIFGSYLKTEVERSGKTAREIAQLFPSASGGLTGCVSNWYLGHNIPTKTQYELIKIFLGNADYLRKDYEELRKDYEELRKDYEELRKDYEELRKDYEELRRPFYLDLAGDNECNVWMFQPPSKRIHPTQKPIEMFEHILRVSSREGDLVFDPCMGSGTTAVAARNTGRDYICGDSHRPYVELARERVMNSDPYQASIDKKTGMVQKSLFEGVTI